MEASVQTNGVMSDVLCRRLQVDRPFWIAERLLNCALNGQMGSGKPALVTHTLAKD